MSWVANHRLAARTGAGCASFTHDHVSELLAAAGSGGQSMENVGYLHDPAWNLNMRTNHGTPTTFAVNVKSELTEGPLLALSFGSKSVPSVAPDEAAFTGVHPGSSVPHAASPLCHRWRKRDYTAAFAAAKSVRRWAMLLKNS